MRLKIFEATSMSHALKMVRAELGDDAVIVSTDKLTGGKGIRVTAAVEADSINKKADISSINTAREARKTGVLKEVERALSFHGLPLYLIEKIIETGRYVNFTDLISALENTLGVLFPCGKLELENATKPIIIIGTPGVGKTIVAAKLATELAIKKIDVTPISIDVKRAGGIEQLKAFTDILKEQLEISETPTQLKNMLKYTRGSVVIIDTFGINPYDPKDLQNLSSFLEVADMEAVLVQPAGVDVYEAEDNAGIFYELGAHKMIASKIHSARRIGSIFTAANAGRFELVGISGSVKVATKLEKIDGKMLAALILKHKLDRKNDEKGSKTKSTK